MFKRLINIQNANKVKAICKAQNFCTNNEKWDLLSAVCLERKPFVTPALNDLENEYKQYLSEVELERSLKSDYEIKQAEEEKRMKSTVQSDTEDVEVLKQTVQDLIDAGMEELNKFRFANRVTEADQKNDLKSLYRKLDKHLVLVLNQKVGNEKYFVLPQGARQDGETLRQSAERILKQSCGPDVKAQIYGNAPCGFYKYKYPKQVQNKNGITGAKIFFYFARYLKGELPKEGLDFRWLDREELSNVLPPPYRKSVSQFLINE